MKTTIDNIFKGLNDKDSERKKALEKLLDRAYDVRKFEIGLFWQRALYFWGFIAASFTAYFLVADKYSNSPHIKLMVSCMGFIFALSWLLVNRASTHWKENWEALVDKIEDELELPLYKLNIRDSGNDIFDRKHYRISRINIIVCYFLCFIWLMLLVSSILETEIVKTFNYLLNNYGLVKTISLLFLTIITTVLLLRTTVRTNNQAQQQRLYRRNNEVIIEND